MSSDPPSPEQRLGEILRRAAPEGPVSIGRADAVVRRSRTANRRRGAAGVFAAGVVALAVVVGPSLFDIAFSPTGGASSSSGLPATCPKHVVAPGLGGSTWSSLDLVRAEVCSYPGDYHPIRGPYPLPSALLTLMNRDYARNVVDHPFVDNGLGLEPTIVVFGQNSEGDPVVMSRYSGAFNRGPVSWEPSRAVLAGLAHAMGG